jgi:nucleoside-diphosphate-sugar epimerase
VPDPVLVTGARGFIGARLVRALRAGGNEVIAHDMEEGDLASGPPAYPRASHVYHLAARASVTESWNATADYYRTNVLATVNVLEFCRRVSAPVTFVSSYVYGPPNQLPVSEDHPLSAFNPYSHTKIVAEDICRYYARQFEIPTAIIRPFNIYGPGQPSWLLIPKLVSQAVDPAARAFQVLDARPRRDYVYVEDLVSLLLAAPPQPEVFTCNAGSGRSYSIAEITDILNTMRNDPIPVVADGVERRSEVMDVVADIERARSIGWEPYTSLEQGLRHMFDAEVERRR